jgi:hypothetical protein
MELIGNLGSSTRHFHKWTYMYLPKDRVTTVRYMPVDPSLAVVKVCHFDSEILKTLPALRSNEKEAPASARWFVPPGPGRGPVQCECTCQSGLLLHVPGQLLVFSGGGIKILAQR